MVRVNLASYPHQPKGLKALYAYSNDSCQLSLLFWVGIVRRTVANRTRTATADEGRAAMME